jgi:hypothetical protein
LYPLVALGCGHPAMCPCELCRFCSEKIVILSPDHKLAMLLPWKTASQTLRLRLGGINRSTYPAFFHFNAHLRRVVHQHLTLSDFLVLPESKLGCRLAVFVRNPYDRVYSGFRQILRDITGHPGRAFPELWIRDLVTEQLARDYALLARAQFNVDAWFQMLPAQDLFDSGHNVSLPLYPVHYWTHVEGTQAAGFIGKVENFEEDFEALCREFGIDLPGRENANQSEETGVADGRGYRYADRLHPHTIAKINECFSADFDIFGYEKIKPVL